MNQDYCSWVPEPVRQECDRVCHLATPYSPREVEAARRLAADPRMEVFYGSASLKWACGLNADVAWRLWFQVALSVTNRDEKGQREAVARQRENVSQLVRVLGDARELLNDIAREQAHAPISVPLEFTDILHLIEATAAHPGIVEPYDRARYEENARPRLDEILSFNGSSACFIPSVVQVLTGLESIAFGLEAALESRQTIPWRGSFVADQLTSQKSSEIRAYVRTVDRAMWEIRWEFTNSDGAECWRLPDSLVALQCKVALGLNDLEGFVDRVRKSRMKPEDF
ncbi:hypothetical protein [Burkholderia pseudomallei]|uniref:hypothetical protein n=1 Tax=Burkholderia pseudomallei TaxID=28450 RepID=UPI000A767DAD|nr:hypothetical protein [Burkholderia pseudomallei]MDV2126863.1 hypothetical protein [Burkholderia pseudomallei]MDV2228043.1 hypothetical protein [Burkholderia pseudomallei]CAJ4634222.1 Uncharacterised protein [Burkholderia pseudomallei]CAJ6707244.1 Uncharacterised protein [Burkholderia pseudomallei]CAJ6874389.1 Uncharacterised protein [Burkholderia pseudomallei]